MSTIQSAQFDADRPISSFQKTGLDVIVVPDRHDRFERIVAVLGVVTFLVAAAALITVPFVF